MLIQLTLIYPLLRKIQITKNFLFLTAVITISFVYLPFNYWHLSPFIEKISESLFIYWFFYIVFAIYIARHYNQAKYFVKNLHKYLRIFLIPSLPLIMVLERMAMVEMNPEINPYFCLSTLFISPLLFILMIDIDISFLGTKKMIINNNLIRTISSWSLGIFCLNPIVIIGFRSFYSALIFNSFYVNLAWLLAETLLIIIVSILTILILGRIGASLLVK